MSSPQEPASCAEFYSVWMCPHCTIVVDRDKDDDGQSDAECENCNRQAEPWIMTGDIQDKEGA